MRRNRRKLAAQLLDQHLCQAVDETLTKANYPALPRPCVFPTLQDPATALPQSAYFSSTPPELPLPNFSRFDLAAFPHFPFSSTTPPLVQTPTPFRTLPKWCPKIPSLTLGDVWRDCLPTFHDLSSLPEPPEAPTALPGATQKQCKDLQVWRPIGTGYGRDQSRFFPPRNLLTSEELGHETGKKVTVKLPPPVACRLHCSDSSVNSSLTMPISDAHISCAIKTAFAEAINTTSVPDHVSEPTQSSTLNQTRFEEEKSGSVLSTTAKPTGGVFKEDAAITPRDALEASQTSLAASNKSNSCPNVIVQTISEAQQRHGPSDSYSLQYNAEQSPYELDGLETEIPYVHADSLTGYSNDQDALNTVPDYEERRTLVDSGVGLRIIISGDNRDMVGLNELVVEHDIMVPTYAAIAAGVPLPISLPVTPPATPPLHPFIDMVNILPVDCIAEAEHILSDAHYCSEQTLFYQTPLSPAQSTEKSHEETTSSSINIADFLKLGHAKNCWCGHCTDELDKAPHTDEKVSISSSTKLADRDRAAADEYDNLTLSLLLHPSESEPDTESDDPEMLSFSEANVNLKKDENVNVVTVEADDWLLFLPAATKPAEEQMPSASPIYVPSSPILHRQTQHITSAPIVAIASSEPLANEASDEYLAVAAPSTATVSPAAPNLSWHDMFPRRPSSMWRAELATPESGRSWRWGRESEEEWWGWAVEEEC
jgi:hypothetical protein